MGMPVNEADVKSYAKPAEPVNPAPEAKEEQAEAPEGEIKKED